MNSRAHTRNSGEMIDSMSVEELIPWLDTETKNYEEKYAVRADEINRIFEEIDLQTFLPEPPQRPKSQPFNCDYLHISEQDNDGFVQNRIDRSEIR